MDAQLEIYVLKINAGIVLSFVLRESFLGNQLQLTGQPKFLTLLSENCNKHYFCVFYKTRIVVSSWF